MARGAMTPTPSNGSMSNGEDRAVGMLCSFTNCKAPPFSGAPLCQEHLQSIGVKPRKPNNASLRNGGPDAPVSGPPSPSATRLGTQPRSPFLRRKTAPSVHMPIVPSVSMATAVPRPSIAVPLHNNHDPGEPREGALPSPSGSLARAHPIVSHKRSRADFESDSSSSHLEDFLPSVTATPESSDGADEALAGGRLVPDRDSSNRGGAATNGIHAENGKLRGSRRGGLNDKENQEEAGPGHTGSGPRGWWDAEYRRRDRTTGTSTERLEHVNTNDLAHARLPIPSTPLRISSLYRRDRGQDRDRGDRPRRLRSVDSLDAYVYNQDGAAEAPPGVLVPSEAEMAAARARAEATASAASSSLYPSPPSYIYAHIDPRIHWMRPRPASWHKAKQAEIRSRGGRKANFGKAAQRMAEQRRRELRPCSGGTGTSGIGTSDIGTSNVVDESVNVTRTAAGRPASPEAAWDKDLPPEVRSNKQWMKFIGLFSQHSEERQKSFRLQRTLRQK